MGSDARQVAPTAARPLQTTFDTSTSAAVLAFQKWSHITADGLGWRPYLERSCG